MRVLNELGARIGDQIRAAVPGRRGRGPRAGRRPTRTHRRRAVRRLGSAQLRVRTCPWVQLSGTGVDKVPQELFEGRTVTCARGASAMPISEFVLGAMLAFEKRFPDVWLHEPPEHWNFDKLGGLSGRTLGIVGFGGIGIAVARARAAVRDAGARAAAHRCAEPGRRASSCTPRSTPLLESSDHLVLAVPLTRPHRAPARRRGVRRGEAGRAPGEHRPRPARGPGRAPGRARRRPGRDGDARHRRPRAAARPATGSTSTRRCG